MPEAQSARHQRLAWNAPSRWTRLPNQIDEQAAAA
jgi:hypothetical protein